MADSSFPGERPPRQLAAPAPLDSAPAASRRATLTLSLLAWALALAELALTGFAGWQLWLAWQTAYEPYWQQLWRVLPALVGVAFVLVAVCLYGPFVAALGTFTRQLRAETERTRQAILAGDDRVAPLAAEQPAPLPPAEWPVGPLEVGPFEPPKQLRQQRSSLVQNIFIVMFVALIIVLFVVVLGVFQSLDGEPFLGGGFRVISITMFGIFALNGLLALLQIIVTLWRRIRRGKQSGPPRLIADDWGIRRLGGGRRGEADAIAWHAVRAFYMGEDRLHLDGGLITEGAAQRTTYTLDSGEDILSWSIWTDSPPARRAESDSLVRLVAARTRLPLRDVSAVVTRQGLGLTALVASFAGPLLSRRFTYQPPAGETSAPGAPSPGVTSPAAPRPVGVRRSRWLALTGWVAVPLALLMLLAGPVGQVIQSTQYTSLTDHLDREMPYYDVDFRINDGAWPAHAADATSGSYTYQSDGYHMTGAPDGTSMEALLPTNYGDAMVRLTAELVGTPPPGDIGIVLRASFGGAEQVVFSVSASGGWALSRYDRSPDGALQPTTLLANTHSDAVHTGVGAFNWLAVLMRGGDYYCFVRGTLVGIYHDSSGQTPRAGQVGLWLGNGQAEGAYYSFSVYPAT